MIINRLQEKYLEKLQKGETISITDLYEFSKVKLKRSRMRKKFHKDYDRYIPKEIKETYWGIIFSRPLVNFFKMYSNLNDTLTIEPISDRPKVELVYLDYKYEPKQ